MADTNSKRVSSRQAAGYYDFSDAFSFMDDLMYEWKVCSLGDSEYALGKLRPGAHALYVALDLLFRFPAYALTGRIGEYRVPQNLAFGSRVRCTGTELAKR